MPPVPSRKQPQSNMASVEHMEQAKFDNDPPIYNSRIILAFIVFLREFYPKIDIDGILEHAGMTRPTVEDQAAWLSQKQVDRFYNKVVTETGNPAISREVGRHSLSTGAFGAVRQYTIGLLGLSYVYLLAGKLNALVSRGAIVKAKKKAPNKIEITSTPAPGVNEKPYQCDNRIGTFESAALLFSDKLARVEHTECYHKGHECCQYIITWENMPSNIFKKISLLIGFTGMIAAAATFPLLTTRTWTIAFLLTVLLITILATISLFLGKKELTKTIEKQGDAAKDLMDETDVRLRNSLLVREIGHTLSRILDIDELLNTVVNTMVRRMNFSRGLVMLANKEKTRLVYSAGYGYDKKKENLVRGTEFHIDNPDSKGPFVLAYQKQKPFLLDDMDDISEELSTKTQVIADQLDVHSLICVPIVFEEESLGILAVDNFKSPKKLTETDIHLLEGVGSQIAVGIINAKSFEKVQESEKRYRELVENVNSIIMRMDADGNISFFNYFARKLFGYTKEEILGRNIRSTILAGAEETGHRFQRLLNDIDRMPERKIVCQVEHLMKAGGNSWITWTCKQVFDHQEKFKEILCVGSDTTELKRAEEEKKDLTAKLQRSQKMEALGTLAGGVAHDLNNILSGIVSYPELLLMDMEEDSPLRKPILTIQESGEKAAAIVQDLLTLARRGVDTAKVVNLNDVILAYLKSPEYDKLKFNYPGVRVKTDFESHLINIFGSLVHLSKVIMNLVANAAEAMPEGGDVLIKTRNRYIDTTINGYDNVEEGDYVTLSVADSGVGILPEDQERIFEPFYTKKLMGLSGTGLGLAIVWGTVKDHNGYIDLKSKEGKGTEFKLYFPVTRQELIQEKRDLSIDDYTGHGESVLVVDDIKGQREIASLMLTKLQYQVASVSSGEDAVRYLKEKPVDLLVLDMIMDPGIDGLETYKEILAIRTGTKAIIASGFSETEKVREAQQLGAGAYVKKPYTIEKLGVAIRRELEKK